MSNAIDDLANALADTRVSQEGVSFQGKSLKLDTAEDAQPIVDAINNCAKLEYLNLEGNTLGVEAAKAIAKALETHPELKRALWKDLFTGRLSSEIPLALEYLSKALMVAGVRLTELDLSDNAFGPVGVEGIAALLRSSSCFNLQELRLNNNGLGITGGKLLAKALLECYKNSKAEGVPLALRVFIAGRNRLENEGATALANVFKTIGSLEEIAMPQNGINHPGMTALSNSFIFNKNLQTLNLNDNTMGLKGSEAMAKALPSLQQLRNLNFGDCLVKTQGAICIADALKDKHNLLENVTLSFNEINADGGLAIAKAMENKKKLKNLVLGGNQFGSEGRKKLETNLKSCGHFDKLGTLSEDESADDDEDDNDSEEEEEEEEEDEDEEEENDTNIENSFNKTQTSFNNSSVIIQEIEKSEETPFEKFLRLPSANNFKALGFNASDIILSETKKLANNDINEYLTMFLPILMKTSALTTDNNTTVSSAALKISDQLYKELFLFAKNFQELPLVGNSLLVHLGLIKSEDKKFKPTWNIDGCMVALENFVKTDNIPSEVRFLLQVFIGQMKSDDPSVTTGFKKLQKTLNSLK